MENEMASAVSSATKASSGSGRRETLPHVDSTIAKTLLLVEHMTDHEVDVAAVGSSSHNQDDETEVVQSIDHVAQGSSSSNHHGFDLSSSSPRSSNFDMKDLELLALICDERIFGPNNDNQNTTAKNNNNAPYSLASSSTTSPLSAAENRIYTSGNKSSLWQVFRRLGSSSCDGNSCADDEQGDEPNNHNNNHHHHSSARIAALTLLALGFLESTIRNQAGYPAGKAPLLSTLIQEMSQHDKHQQNNHENKGNTMDHPGNSHESNRIFLASILQSLLLSKEKKNQEQDGLNLRNLIWHGFVGALPRPWLALVLYLIQELDYEQLQPQEGDSQLSTTPGCASSLPSTHPKQEDSAWDYYQVAWSEEIRRGNELRMEIQQNPGGEDIQRQIAAWLPSSHSELLDLAFAWMDQYPACSTAVLAVLLEHGLRLEWCRVNHRPTDAVAQPGRYYVTLDGHGQRNQHNLLLHPYITAATMFPTFAKPEQTPKKDDKRPVPRETPINNLIHHLGPSTISFLSDLFCSAGGPNIRAALGHGLWDSLLWHELEQMAATNVLDNDDPGNSSLSTCAIPQSEQQQKQPQQQLDLKEEQSRRFLQPMVSLMVLALYQSAATATISVVTPFLSTPGWSSRSAKTIMPWMMNDYAPKFSFAATTYQSLQSVRSELHRLNHRISRLLQLPPDKYCLGPEQSRSPLYSHQANSTVMVGGAYHRTNLLISPPVQVLECLLEELMQRLEWRSEAALRQKQTDILQEQQQQQQPQERLKYNGSDDHDKKHLLFRELKLNEKLAPAGAVRTLLDDIVQACRNFSSCLPEWTTPSERPKEEEEGDRPPPNPNALVHHHQNQNQYADHRRRPNSKKAQRMMDLAPVALNLFRFTLYIALVAIKEAVGDASDDKKNEVRKGTDTATAPPTTTATAIKDSTLLKAVERSRMVISTTSNFWVANSDRAIKAIHEYGKSKAIQSFVQKWNPVVDPN